MTTSHMRMSADSSEALGDLEIRRASGADLDAIVALARRSLGWDAEDDARFFQWKHFENPFGDSPMWTATSNGRVVGFRAFLRWQFTNRDGVDLRAVRAVDTATDPDFQGRGIFTRLTLHGVDELADEGVEAVFNTPNSKSRPGYLKMGWHVVGRPEVTVKPKGVASLVRLAGARTAASRAPIDLHVGERPADVFADLASTARLLSRVPRSDGWATTYSPEYLRWRYGLAPLGYRVLLDSGTLEDGLAVFRLRRRGRAVAATVCDVLVPEDRGDVDARLMKRITSIPEADYLLGVDRRVWADGFLRVPRIGPILTFRRLDGGAIPTIRDLALRMGDLELF
jgi:GNAT superfamily N-acetyltransferase